MSVFFKGVNPGRLTIFQETAPWLEVQEQHKLETVGYFKKRERERDPGVVQGDG